MQTKLAPATLLTLAVFLVFGQVRSHDFVGIDDPAYVAANPEVTRGLDAEGLAWAFTTGHEANWHPLTWLSHMLDHGLFGPVAGRHLLVNVGLHALTTLLLFLLVQRTMGAPLAAFLTAGLFALHPQHVEAVAWAAQRKEMLAGVFGLLAMHAWVARCRGPRGRWGLATAVALALGLACKPILVTLPFLLVLLDRWPLARWREAGGLAGLLREKAPLFALVAGSCVVTLLVQDAGGAVAGAHELSLPERLSNATVASVLYLVRTVWPVDLAFFYPHPAITGEGWGAGAVAGSAALLVGVSAFAWIQRARRPYLLVGWLWYLGSLVPMLGLVQVGGQASADRYTYLPLVGIFLALGAGLDELVRRAPRLRPAALGCCALALAACALLSHRQVAVWRDSTTLARHALAVTEDNWTAHLVLAGALRDAGRDAEARDHLAEAVRIAPGLPTAHYNLANTLLDLGDTEGARTHYEATLAAAPHHGRAHFNLAGIRFDARRLEEAARHYEAARGELSHRAELHVALGNTYVLLDRMAEAVEAYDAALALDPTHPQALGNRAAALGRLRAGAPPPR